MSKPRQAEAQNQSLLSKLIFRRRKRSQNRELQRYKNYYEQNQELTKSLLTHESFYAHISSLPKETRKTVAEYLDLVKLEICQFCVKNAQDERHAIFMNGAMSGLEKLKQAFLKKLPEDVEKYSDLTRQKVVKEKKS